MRQAFKVDFAYPVVFQRELFRCPGRGGLGAWFGERCETGPVRFLCVLDAGFVGARPEIPGEIAEYAARHSERMRLAGPPLVLPGGEAAKNSFRVPFEVVRAVRRARLCRHSVVLCAGGGAFLDAVGFAVSLVHRGLPLVRVPTTVLSQGDSGIGVKNGINSGGIKNFLGTFAPPAAVFNDVTFLTTLSDRDWIAGTAEAVKVACIEDRGFLDWLENHAAALAARDLDRMETLLRRCARLHLEHIARAGDPFEFGAARPLDFGHWCAHKLESLSGYRLRHGEAVAVGMALDLLYAADLGFIEEDAALRVLGILERLGFATWHSALDSTDAAGRPLVFQGIEEFREHLGGQLHITLPCPLGASREITRMDEGRLRRCLDRLRGRARRSGTAAGG